MFDARDEIVERGVAGLQIEIRHSIDRRAIPAVGAGVRDTRELRAWREAFQRKQAYKAERAAERAKGHTLEVGHILYSSWGYEQTNIDFFQVVAVPSKCFVEVRPIGSIRTEDGPNYTGKVVPNIDSFKGPSQRCRADARNAVKIDRHYAGLWHGRPVAYSAYY